MGTKDTPTVPDLVVLSLLAEQPRHGYDINAELIRRDVRDWAGISRPQVYYSLKKAHEAAWISLRGADHEPHGGPERQVYQLTAKGRIVLADALERADWATDRSPPPFLTWLALSSHARPHAVTEMVAKRRNFLEGELARERLTMADLLALGGNGTIAPILMVDLTIRQFELELAWLKEVADKLG